MDIQTVLEYGRTEKVHFHSEVELIYVLEGSIGLVLTDQEYTLNKGDIILVNSSMLHSWRCPEDSLLCRIYFDYSFLQQIVRDNDLVFWCNSLLGNEKAYDEMRTALNRAVYELASRNGERSLELNSVEYRILSVMINNFLVREGTLHGVSTEEERIKKAVSYINANYMHQMSLNMVAAECFMSESSFSKLFKRETDMTYVEYLNYVRLQHGIRGLSETRKNITDIALECGFAYASSFDKAFRKEFGISPRKYREFFSSVTDEKQTEVYQKLSQYYSSGYTEQEMETNDDPEHRVITVEAEDEKYTGVYNREGIEIIDVGHVQDLLFADIRRQLEGLVESCGFRYVRIHNPFADNMYFYSEDGDSFNYANMDNIFDYLIDLKLIPFIDMSNDSKRVYMHFGEDMFASGRNPAERVHMTVEKYGEAVADFMEHITYRYGRREIEKWRFELACQPYLESREKAYIDYWGSFYTNVKARFPEYSVGGDAYKINSDIGILESHCRAWKESGMIPDFITFTADSYHGASMSRDIYTWRENDFRFMRNNIDRHIRSVREFLPEIRNFCFSGWNITASDRNWFNDCVAKTAQVAQIMMSFAGTGIDICYNYGLDYLSQYFDIKKEFMGARGMISKNGIPKPVSVAFSFMNQLYRNIAAAGDNYIITENGNGSFYILACNPKKFNHTYFLHAENEISIDMLDDLFEDEEPVRMHFSISSIENNKYRLKKQVQNKEHGNLLKVWKDLGYYESLNHNDLEYLRKSVWPYVYSEIIEVKDGVLSFDLELQPHETVLIHLYAVK